MFKEALKSLVDSTDGGVAGLLMDSSGIALESYAKDDAPFDINTIGIEFSVVIGQIKRATEMLEAGAAHDLARQRAGLVVVRVRRRVHEVGAVLAQQCVDRVFHDELL